MDFSVYEKRQLAVLERQLADDRRLVALLSVFGTQESALRKRFRYELARLRHRPQRQGSKPARIAVTVAVVLNVLGPLTLIAAVVTGVPVLSIAAIAILPTAPIALVLAQHWVRRSALPRQQRGRGPARQPRG